MWFTLGWLTLAHAAPACVADDVCAPTTSPCVVDAAWEIGDGCALDFGARDVRVVSRGRLDAGQGSATVLAGALTVDSGELRGRDGGTLVVRVAGALVLDGLVSFTSSGRPGRFEAHAAFLWQLGRIDASATASDADGGAIVLEGSAAVRADGPLDAAGGREGAGGVVQVTSRGSVEVTQGIDASGGAWDGGVIELHADGPIHLSGGTTTVSGGGDGGSGGLLRVIAGGTVDVDAALRANGGDGGWGGTIVLRSRRGSLLVAGSAQANGGGLDGDGGALLLRAHDALYATATLSASGPGAESAGGAVTAQAGRTASLRAPVSATGGAYGGGSVAVYGRDRVEVLTTLDADGGGGDGDGGTITARGAAVWVDGATLRARGASGGGGGEVTIEACELDISRTAALDTLRAGGHNLLIVHGDATVAGTLDAGDHNELRYLAAPPTIDPGARLRPAPTLVADPGLAACPA